MNFSKIRFYQNFRIYCDKFDNKLIYCLSRFIAGNFSSAPTSYPSICLIFTCLTIFTLMAWFAMTLKRLATIFWTASLVLAWVGLARIFFCKEKFPSFYVLILIYSLSIQIHCKATCFLLHGLLANIENCILKNSCCQNQNSCCWFGFVYIFH